MNQQLLNDCTLCPRDCHIDRTREQKGYCRENDELVVARAALHLWEEPCLSGVSGSGTVFFSGCSLGCIYCQNYMIANGLVGKKITRKRLSEIFMELQEKGANNINLVTPSHYVPQIIQAINLAKEMGLYLPIVYNCSGYEKITTLKLLDGYINIYLPDMKYMDQNPAIKYSNCSDYFEYASKAIEEMVRQVGQPMFNANGIMTKGVIVRHLSLPGYLQDSKDIIKYLYNNYGEKIYISIMNQYTPMATVEKYPEINRTITEEEYNELIDFAIDLGIVNGFVQEGETASESFIPKFNEEGV